MKTHLLPNKFKKIGIIMFVPSFVLCAWIVICAICDHNELIPSIKSLPCISLFDNPLFGKFKMLTISETDPVNEIAMLVLLVSLCFIALSREKDEDEMTGLIRMRSFVWSFWATAILLAFGIIFFYELSFMYFAFMAIYFEFMVFIAKFNIEMHKVRRESK